jgi:GNAT superfamily N-acetyltransferase
MTETTHALFSIRSAQRSDAPLILEFVKELADYERLSHQVVATVADFEQHLFGPQPAAHVVIGYEGDTPVGFALYFLNFSTFLGRPGIYLEDLFVRPEYRGRGYGKALLVHLGQIALQKNYGRVEWSVLDWNQPAIDFYQSIGARQLSEWIINRVDGPGIEALAKM